jgi:hypothetical protein
MPREKKSEGVETKATRNGFGATTLTWEVGWGFQMRERGFAYYDRVAWS